MLIKQDFKLKYKTLLTKDLLVNEWVVHPMQAGGKCEWKDSLNEWVGYLHVEHNSSRHTLHTQNMELSDVTTICSLWVNGP